MSRPEGTLTSTQYEIIQVVWEHGAAGAAVAEIWQAIAAKRPVARTTVLNLVDRLEKRGWLIRLDGGKPYRYRAALDRRTTDALLAGEFVDDFFGGSASKLVMSLLGTQRLAPEEIERLRELLEPLSSRNRGRRGGRDERDRADPAD